MIPLKSAFSSSVGQKLITALTGLALVLFIILHLLGNLTLLDPNPDRFNAYAHALQGYGLLLTIAEFGLAAVFLIHIVNGFRLKLNHRAARPTRYRTWRSKDGPSKANLSSLYMAVTGIILLVFLVIHVKEFRFGPSEAEGYRAMLNGMPVRDLHRLVVGEFQEIGEVVFYVITMIVLGFHLRHGFWSALQSMGVNNARNSKPIYALSVVLGVVLAVGFLIIPVVIHFGGYK